jgi:hypothetical protein
MLLLCVTNCLGCTVYIFSFVAEFAINLTNLLFVTLDGLCACVFCLRICVSFCVIFYCILSCAGFVISHYPVNLTLL